MNEAPAPAVAPLAAMQTQGRITSQPKLVIVPAFDEKEHFGQDIRKGWLERAAYDFKQRGFDVEIADANATNLDANKLAELVTKHDPKALLVYSFARSNGADDTALNHTTNRLKGLLASAPSPLPFAIDAAHHPCTLGFRESSDEVRHGDVPTGIIHTSANACIATYLHAILGAGNHDQARIAAQAPTTTRTLP